METRLRQRRRELLLPLVVILLGQRQRVGVAEEAIPDDVRSMATRSRDEHLEQPKVEDKSRKDIFPHPLSLEI
jgi:hypothetical protein